jgi:hypothetical protein
VERAGASNRLNVSMCSSGAGWAFAYCSVRFTDRNAVVLRRPRLRSATRTQVGKRRRGNRATDKRASISPVMSRPRQLAGHTTMHLPSSMHIRDRSSLTGRITAYSSTCFFKIRAWGRCRGSSQKQWKYRRPSRSYPANPRKGVRYLSTRERRYLPGGTFCRRLVALPCGYSGSQDLVILLFSTP